MIRCLDDDDLQANFAPQTIRAVGQRLRTWDGDPLFQSATGTPVTTLVQAGVLSILCLHKDLHATMEVPSEPWFQFG